MKSIKALAVLLVAGAMASIGFAGPTSTLIATRRKASQSVVPGVWHAGFSKCKAYAKEHGVPLIAVWSNGDACGHCVMFETSCNNSTFKKWMKDSGCVFYFIYSGDHGDGNIGSSVFHWIRNNKNTAYPFVRVWWPKGGVDIPTVGDNIDGGKDGSKGAKNAVAWFKKKLKNFKPVAPTPAYTGGGFDVEETDNSRLEASAGITQSVPVPLSRASNVAAKASTNTVVAVYPDGHAVTNTVYWDSGESATNIVVDTSSLTAAGGQVTLIMLNDKGQGVATNHITAVEEPENSPKNPKWIGEDFGWGEWTMDIDAATNKVAAYNSGKEPSVSAPRGAALPLDTPPKAYTLLLVGGPLWCPDCVNNEEYLVNTDQFREWATNTHRIACVAIDEPMFGGGYNDRPTLLTAKSYDVSWLGGVTSGASYLSRKGLTEEDAAAVLERNLSYINNTTTNGGYCLPDNTGTTGNTGKWKTGIPCFILLRDDGTVAGRLFQFSNSTDMLGEGMAATLVKRLEEMVAQADEAAEEANDTRHTTTETVGKREVIADRTLSFTDTADFYRLKADAIGKRISFALSAVQGQAFAADTALSIKVFSVSGTKTSTLASTNGLLSAGVSCTADIPADTNLAYYVAVGYPMDENSYSLSTQFAVTNAASTVCHYAMETDFVAIPTEVAEKVEFSSLSEHFTVALISNETYRLTGIVNDSDALESIDGTIFRARVTGSVKLDLNYTTVTYQLWHPGKVGFATASAVAVEPDGPTNKTPYAEYKIRLVRKEGVSGTATAKVTLDGVKSSGLDQLIELPDDFVETQVWNEGESEDKYLTLRILNNPYADGDQTLYFDLVSGGDATNGINRLRLTLRDNDPKRPGKVAIVSTNPAIAQDRTAYARAGDVMAINVGRVDGSDGDLEATISASAGTLDQTDLAWPRRVAADQTVSLTLPDAKGTTMNVEVVPAKGTSVDPDRRKLTVKLLDADVPGFEEGAVEISAMRYIPILPEREIALDAKAAATAKVKLVSGSLAAGLSWRLEAGKLVISGTPTKAGVTTARFRVFNGNVGGLVTAVTVDVTDPVTSGGGGNGSEPINASVAKSRTFADIPVFSTATNRLAGVLTFTLPRSGRASAKYRMAEGTVTLSCDSWCGIDEETGALSVALMGSFKGDDFGLAVDAFPDGSVVAWISDPLHGDVECFTDGNIWSKANPASDFKGYYTVSMPIETVASGNALAKGAAYITLKMNTASAINAGKFAYAGVYPNGKPFSGSAVATAKDWVPGDGFKYWSRAVVPIIIANDSDALSGAVQVMPGAADPSASDIATDGSCEGRCHYALSRRSVWPAEECALVWNHREDHADASCEATLGAFGTYYVSTEDFVSCCEAIGNKLSFFSCATAALPEDLEDSLGKGEFKNGGALTVATKTVVVTHIAANKKKKKPASNTIKFVPAKDKKKKPINPNSLTLSFALSSGIVSGSFKLPLENGNVTMTYKGVVMPGWGTSSSCEGGCSAGGPEAARRPFISGTAWFNDTLEYDDENGRVRKVTVRRSVPFSIGAESGK